MFILADPWLPSHPHLSCNPLSPFPTSYPTPVDSIPDIENTTWKTRGIQIACRDIHKILINKMADCFILKLQIFS